PHRQRGGRQRDRRDDLALRDVDDGDRAAVLGRHIRTRAVGGEDRVAGPPADVYVADHFAALRVDDADAVVALAREVERLAIGGETHALGLAADGDRADDAARREVDGR